MLPAGNHYLLGTVKEIIGNDSQFFDWLRTSRTIFNDACIHDILENAVNGCVGNIGTRTPDNALVEQVMGNALRTVSFVGIQVENKLHNFSF